MGGLSWAVRCKDKHIFSIPQRLSDVFSLRPVLKIRFRNQTDMDTCRFGRLLHLSVGWNQDGWKLEAGAKNFLTKTKTLHQWYDVGSYAYDSHSRSDSYGPQLYVKVSYSFDFGRKVKREQIKADDVPQSGILQFWQSVTIQRTADHYPRPYPQSLFFSTNETN